MKWIGLLPNVEEVGRTDAFDRSPNSSSMKELVVAFHELSNLVSETASPFLRGHTHEDISPSQTK